MRRLPITIALGGDMMLGRLVADELARRAPAEVWSPELRDVFAEADLAIVNLECCISRRGRPWTPDLKPFHFRAPPVAVEAIAAAGIAAVWLANNHALDFGEIALSDTFDALEKARIAWAGAGRDVGAARAGAIVSVSGVRIGLVGFADHPADFAAGDASPGIAYDSLERGPPDWLLQETRRRAAESDLVIAGPHWGPNMNPTPPANHRAIARALVAAGADVVAGHSAHVFQGVEIVGESLVCYDLGDLLDDYRVDSVLRNDLGILALLRPGERLELVPLKLDFARTGLATGADHAWILDRIRSASTGTAMEVDRGRIVIDLTGEGR